MNEPRECLQWFAKEMERKLKRNDHKGGWEEESWTDLLDRLDEELDELKRAFNNGWHFSNPRRIIREAADVANFAMMLADQMREVDDDK